MIKFLRKLVPALALGVIAVQGAAVPQDAPIPFQVTRVASDRPTRVRLDDPESTIGETVYLTSTIPLNDVMQEGDVYELTASNTQHSSYLLE